MKKAVMLITTLLITCGNTGGWYGTNDPVEIERKKAELQQSFDRLRSVSRNIQNQAAQQQETFMRAPENFQPGQYQLPNGRWIYCRRVTDQVISCR